MRLNKTKLRGANLPNNLNLVDSSLRLITPNTLITTLWHWASNTHHDLQGLMQTTRDCRFTWRRGDGPQAAVSNGAVQPNAHYPRHLTSMRDTYDTQHAGFLESGRHRGEYGQPPKPHQHTPPNGSRTGLQPHATPGGATSTNSQATPNAGEKNPTYSSSGGRKASTTPATSTVTKHANNPPPNHINHSSFERLTSTFSRQPLLKTPKSTVDLHFLIVGGRKRAGHGFKNPYRKCRQHYIPVGGLG
jgi:hypothetical protein